MSIFQVLGSGVTLGKPRPHDSESDETTISSPHSVSTTSPPHSVSTISSPLSFYRQKSLFFQRYCYAVTISAKETPRLKNKTVKQQYELYCHFLKTTFSNCSYLFSFEYYKCGDYIHCHGFVKCNTAGQAKELRKSIYEYFMLRPLEKRKSYSPLVDFNKINDFDAWTKYVFEETDYSLIMGIPPTFKIIHSEKDIVYKSYV